MENVKIFNSIIDETIKNEIIEANWCTDLIQYSTWKCKMDGLIAAAYLFCPQIIQVIGYVFIKQFWNCNEEESIERIRSLEEQYDNDKKTIEMSVNTWSLGDFFIGDTKELMDNEKLVQQFGDALKYFWEIRVKDLFPEREIIVELGNDLMGEIGLCITMYEATS